MLGEHHVWQTQFVLPISRQTAEFNIQEATVYKSSLTMSAAAFQAAASVTDDECNMQAMCLASLTCS